MVQTAEVARKRFMHFFSSQRWWLWHVGIFGRLETPRSLRMCSPSLLSGIRILWKIYLCMLTGSRHTKRIKF
jgi:hypothetical protein